MKLISRMPECHYFNDFSWLCRASARLDGQGRFKSNQQTLYYKSNSLCQSFL